MKDLNSTETTDCSLGKKVGFYFNNCSSLTPLYSYRCPNTLLCSQISRTLEGQEIMGWRWGEWKKIDEISLNILITVQNTVKRILLKSCKTYQELPISRDNKYKKREGAEGGCQKSNLACCYRIIWMGRHSYIIPPSSPIGLGNNESVCNQRRQETMRAYFGDGICLYRVRNIRKIENYPNFKNEVVKNHMLHYMIREFSKDAG